MLRPFWICYDAFLLYQCTCCFSTYDEWCFSSVFGWFCGLLHWWHFHFLKKMANHECHVRLVLEKFWEVSIYAKLGNCGFHQFKVEFLGYIIFRDGSNHCGLGYPNFCLGCSMFFRFPNFYQQFIAHYSMIVTPFTRLIWKDQPFSWGVKAENVFQSLKASFIITPLLIQVDPSNLLSWRWMLLSLH